MTETPTDYISARTEELAKDYVSKLIMVGKPYIETVPMEHQIEFCRKQQDETFKKVKEIIKDHEEPEDEN